MKYLVEIVICDYDDAPGRLWSERWHADGVVVAELPSRLSAERLAATLRETAQKEKP